MDQQQGFPFFLAFVGIIVILSGAVAGIVFGNVETVVDYDLDDDWESDITTESKFLWPVAVEWWMRGLVSGFLLIGLARVIAALEETRTPRQDSNNEDKEEGQIHND